MRAIVFGATGFLGSHVVEALTGAGHAVTACVRDSSNTAVLDPYAPTIVRADFASAASLQKAIEGSEVVFNCIADVRLHKPLETYRRTDVAVSGTVAEAAAAARVKRFVQLSTIEVYGEPRADPPFTERTPCRPAFPYQQATLEREHAVQEVADRKGLDLVLLRPVSALGRRNPPFEMLARAHGRGRFPLIGPGTAPFSGVDARDVGRAMVWLAEQTGAAGETYLLKAFETTWLEVKEVMDELRNAHTKIQRLPVPLAYAVAGVLESITPYSKEPALTRFVVRLLTTPHLYDDSKLRATGFAPRYGLREAIARLFGGNDAAAGTGATSRASSP